MVKKTVSETLSEQVFPTPDTEYKPRGFADPLVSGFLPQGPEIEDPEKEQTRAGLLARLPAKVAGEGLGAGYNLLTGKYSPFNPVSLKGFFTEPQSGGLNYEQLSAISEMKASRTQDPEEIDARARDIVRRLPDISGAALKEATAAEFLIDTEGSGYEGLSLSEAIRKPKREARRDASAKATKEARARGEVGGFREMTEDEITRARANTEAELTKEDVREELDPEARKRVEESDTRKQIQAGETGTKAIVASTDVAGSTDAPGGASGAGGDKTGLNSEVGETAVTSLVAALSQEGNEDEKADLGQKYIDEFMSRMPKYEGKTRFEKSMDLMKFGMAIAAGQDPNAIANISKGFLAMGDTFTEDAKERRKYKKEVGLAAAKYGLDQINKDRDLDKADKRDLLWFVDPVTNESKWVSKKDLINDTEGTLTKGLVTEAAYKELSAIVAAQNKTTTAFDKIALEAAILKPDERKDYQKRYKDAAHGIISANTGIGYFTDALADMAKAQAKGTPVTGATGAGRALIQKFYDLANMKSGQAVTQKQFVDKLRRGFQKIIPETLGDAQSANSISNRDVEILAKAILGASVLDDDGFLKFAFVNPEILYNKLQSAVDTFHTKRNEHYNELNQVDLDLADRYLAGATATGEPGLRVGAKSIVSEYRGDPKLQAALAQLGKERKEYTPFKISEEETIKFEDLNYEEIIDDKGFFQGFEKRTS